VSFELQVPEPQSEIFNNTHALWNAVNIPAAANGNIRMSFFGCGISHLRDELR